MRLIVSIHLDERSMRSKHNNILALIILTVISISFIGSVAVPENVSVKTHPLSKKGDKVVEYLLKDWKKQFRSTDIATAMMNLGMKQDDKLRLSIGEYLRENRRIAKNLRWWGPNNYILSKDEKRIAKYIIHIIEKNREYPSLRESAKALELSQEYIGSRLKFMEAVGLLKKSESNLKYSLVDNYNTWGGPLRYNYHTVHVEGEKPFGVW